MKKNLLLAIALCLGLIVTRSAASARNDWRDHCAVCHGQDGKGNTKKGRELNLTNLTDPRVQSVFTDEQAFNIITKGVKDENQNEVMHPIPDLTEPQVKALIKYVRALKK